MNEDKPMSLIERCEADPNWGKPLTSPQDFADLVTMAKQGAPSRPSDPAPSATILQFKKQL